MRKDIPQVSSNTEDVALMWLQFSSDHTNENSDAPIGQLTAKVQSKVSPCVSTFVTLSSSVDTVSGSVVTDSLQSHRL